MSFIFGKHPAVALAMVCALPLASRAQPSPGVFGPGPGCNLFPAPASVGATVGLSYFGPPPSETNPSLVGPVQLLKSGRVDQAKGTITCLSIVDPWRGAARRF